MEDTFIIKNYQIIKDGHIKIRPGITLITGPSNNGKSSIFKAYKQLIYNLPGNTYINQFANECKLILDNDKYTIEYRKEKTKSSYDIKIVNPETTLHIDKLGVNQIDKVKELTHIDKEKGYNFWDQLEKPFLLDRTNREQFLLLQESPISSNLINIQDRIKADIKILNDDILVSQGSLNIINNNLLKYADILQYSEKINTLVSNIDLLKNLDSKINSINSKINALTDINNKLLKIESISDIELKIDITDIYNRYIYFNDAVCKFISVSTQINDININIDKTEKELSSLKKIMTDYFSICPLCGNILNENHNI